MATTMTNLSNTAAGMLRTTARVAAAGAITVGSLAGLATVGQARTNDQLHQASVPAGHAPAGTPYGAGDLTVAVLLGSQGTIGTDALGPYEVFASSPAFTTYTVAARPGPAPVLGGPAIVPTYTFEQLAAGAAAAPDVIVVPALEHPDSDAEQPLRAFVADQVQRGTRVLSVCNGAAVLAAADVLNDLTATAHWSRLGALRGQYPQVGWVAGQRYMDANTGVGTITTTAGISSGIPAALHVVADLAGEREAERVSKLVQYPGGSPAASTQIPTQRFTASDVPGLVNAALPWGRSTVGIELDDGVGEIDVAAAFEVFTVSHTARTVALAKNGWITTRHGIVMAATPPAAAPRTDATRALPTVRTGDTAGPGFAGALQYLADMAGTRSAASAAKMLDYPGGTEGAALRWPAARGLALVAIVIVGLTAALTGLGRWIRSVRRRRRGLADLEVTQPTAVSAN